MMNDLREEALNTFIKMVRGSLNKTIIKIILFGSYARGDAIDTSDIDIFIVTSKKRFETLKTISGIAIDIILDTGVYISTKAVTSKEYAFMKELNTGFYQNLANEGVAVE